MASEVGAGNGSVRRYRLRVTGLVGALLPVALGVLIGGVGLHAVTHGGGPLGWVLLAVGTGWTLVWLRLPWALRLSDPDGARPGHVTFLAPLRRTTVPADHISVIAGRWSGGMNRWFLASVWVEIEGRALGIPLPVGFTDPDAVREDLLRLNPSIRMDA